MGFLVCRLCPSLLAWAIFISIELGNTSDSQRRVRRMPDRDLETELIQRAIAGDRAALSQLLLIHHDALRRHIDHESAGRQLGVMLADDILQQSFVRAALNIRTFENREVGSLRGWLKSIATNLIKDARKRRGRERRANSPHNSHSDDG